MSAFLKIVIVVVAVIIAGVFVFGNSDDSDDSLGGAFSRDGNVVRNNPGQEPNVWYLVYDSEGAPGRSVQLKFEDIDVPSWLTVGDRVRVEGGIAGSVIFVDAISEIDEDDDIGMMIKLYYYNPVLDQGPGGVQCTKNGLVAVDRIIPKTDTPLRDSINLLLRGELSVEEQRQGIETEFPLDGVTLKSATISNGVATLTFDDPNFKLSGGSCRVAILWFQIEATALQFSTVNEVKFLPEDIFQP